MDNESTIPSQLGPVHTIPAPLISSSGRDDAQPEGNGGFGLMTKLVFAALAIALLVYMIG
jgi:hypothetical protein